MVVDPGAPLVVKAFAWVSVLVKVRPVEVSEAVRVGRKVAGNPIDQHPDSGPMRAIDEGTKIVRRAVAARRCVHSGGLIAPRSVEGVLGDRQQLEMRKAEIFDVRDQRVGEVAIRQRQIAALAFAPPRPEMDLIDRDGLVARDALRALLHPRFVGPNVARRRRDDRGGRRSQLALKSQRIALERQERAARAGDFVLVRTTRQIARDENLPDPALGAKAHRMDPAVPSVEVADDADATRVRRPDREGGSVDAVACAPMRAEDLPQAQVVAFGDQPCVRRSENLSEAIGIVEL